MSFQLVNKAWSTITRQFLYLPATVLHLQQSTNFSFFPATPGYGKASAWEPVEDTKWIMDCFGSSFFDKEELLFSLTLLVSDEISSGEGATTVSLIFRNPMFFFSRFGLSD